MWKPESWTAQTGRQLSPGSTDCVPRTLPLPSFATPLETHRTVRGKGLYADRGYSHWLASQSRAEAGRC